MLAVITAPVTYILSKKFIPSRYQHTAATDEMSDEEWHRIRDEEEKKAGWTPKYRVIVAEKHKIEPWCDRIPGHSPEIINL